MSEMSDMFKLVNAMELAKTARVGMSLTYFDVIELLGEINSLYEYIDELEAGNTAIKQHPQPIEFWSDEKKQIYKINESRTVKSGSEECGE